MRAAILDDYQNAALVSAPWDRLGPQVQLTIFDDTLKDETSIAQRLRDFEIIVAMRERTPFTGSLLEQLPELRLLVTTGMRNAAIDLAAAARRNILVCGTDLLGYPTAELAWGLIIALARNIASEDRGMRDGRWQTTLGAGLRQKTLGILGLGKLGGEVASFAKAFQMKVIAWSPNLDEERAQRLSVQYVGKDELFRAADFLTIHMVLSARSRGLVGERELSLMKPTAYLINTSRGPIVDEDALLDILDRRGIAGAALDVYAEEPLPPDHRLRRLDNVLMTPHLGYVTAENYRLAYSQVVEDILAFLAGKPIRLLTAAT